MPDIRSTVADKCKGNTSIKLRSELKSSIPKPTPYIRNRGNVRAALSYQSQPSYSTRIPLAKYQAADRGKTSASLRYGATSIPNTPLTQNNYESKWMNTAYSRPQSPRPQSPRSQSSKPKQDVRPKSAVHAKNPYANVKAKINSRPTATPKIKSRLSPVNIQAMKSDEFNLNKTLSVESAPVSLSKEEKQIGHEELLEKRKQLLSIYSELQKLQPNKDLQPEEKEICRLMENKTIGQLEDLSLENSLLMGESLPEFLTTFEKQMQDVSEYWLKLLCDIISAKLVAGTATLDCLYVPEHTPNLREEIHKCLSTLSTLSTDGEPLNLKLKWIEDEQVKAITVVLHSVMTLVKQYEDLKDKHFRLEKTQDQIHFELKEEIAILGDENEELDRKYSEAVEKYNLEKVKTEQQEKQKYKIQKDMLEVKKMMKYLEGKCAEWEGKAKKLDASCRYLEGAIRCRDSQRENDLKQHREMFNKHQDSTEIIHKLKTELEELKQEKTSLEERNTALKSFLDDMKISLNESDTKRSELIHDLSTKDTKINELELKLDKIKSSLGHANPNLQVIDENLTSNVLVDDLTRDVRQRNIQIMELKKKAKHLEHSLKEATAREELLLLKVAELEKQPRENDIALRAQIKDLNSTIKELTEEIVELERIIAQKTLELDQRDLLMQQHSEILRTRDELIPMIQNKQNSEKECIEKLRSVVIEHEKMYCNQNSDRFGMDNKPFLEAMKNMDDYYNIDRKMMAKELTFRQEKMAELFSLLERKQMDVIKLERRIRQLEGGLDQQQEIKPQREKDFREENSRSSRGFFSFFAGQDPTDY